MEPSKDSLQTIVNDLPTADIKQGHVDNRPLGPPPLNVAAAAGPHLANAIEQQQQEQHRHWYNNQRGERVAMPQQSTIKVTALSLPRNVLFGRTGLNIQRNQHNQNIHNVSAKPPKNPPMDQTAAQLRKPRNKSDEAIADLLLRIPEIGRTFDVHNRIGNGTFSTVLLATLKKEALLSESLRRKFAIKHHIPTSHPDRIMKELQCMTQMGGTNNVVGIHCCMRCGASAAFVMPYMAHDRFHDFYTKMDINEIRLYMNNLLIALRHVHKFNIIHRDVKPSNFLYNRRRREFLLVDFGLAQQVTSTVQKAKYIDAPPGVKRARGDDTCEQQQQQQQQQEDRGPLLVVGETEAFAGVSVDGTKRIRLTTEALADALKSTSVKGSRKLVKVQSGKPMDLTNDVKTEVMPGPAAGAAANTQKQTDQTTEQSMAAIPAAKYNTSRNSNSNTNIKCNCFANNTVCIACLTKKEVHASRAGTPGYRPPEVLLKYADQTTAVDIWAAGVMFLSILSSVYPFFKAPNDFIALAEIVTVFGDRAIRKTALELDRMLTLSQRSRPIDLRKLCLRFRYRHIFGNKKLVQQYASPDGSCEVCKNCDQYYFNCLCEASTFQCASLEPYECFPASAYDLLRRLLEVNPLKRITAEEALAHPFFTAVEEQGEHLNQNNCTEDSTSLKPVPITSAQQYAVNCDHNQTAMHKL